MFELPLEEKMFALENLIVVYGVMLCRCLIRHYIDSGISGVAGRID